MFERHPARKLAAIFIGGVVGALIRVGLSEAFPHEVDAWPWPTFAVNVAGAFLIGYFFAAFRDHRPDQIHHPFFATGICGTLTTFSTMQLELFNMVDAGEPALASVYLAASLAVGYLALRLGIATEASRPDTRT
ncbi:MAG: fluoride exporter [Actinomycetota bacterium]|jgi:CrcB protein|nr:fluoride exporter [Actinomycetota bacterium]